ncbi:MAG: Gldg family protein [Anaerolineae bacterium]|nr:Gldg family protein [Anaerolineae bacterium]
MKRVLSITRKELEGYFGSPMALIFVGVFLAVTLFSFFWVDTFFARGIADVRPLFRWMPVLLIFLVAALTMRQWSEEERSGTLEVLLSLPVSPIQLVLGKFLAVMALVAVALGLTIFLPITVEMLGNLDWGPVIGGYLAALLLAAAYTAIGLFISSRTDNQIVALILAVLLCGTFYLVGTRGVTEFFGDTIAEILRAIGSGSRFESIERGVIDLRDLLYYLSLTGIFLTLNGASLHAKRWSSGERTRPYRRAVTLTSVLVVVNLVLMNVWAFPLRAQTLRLDLTDSRQYTLSQTTRDLLSNLQEPLLVRGYFSEKTHPLLAPLVPEIRDMLREYEVAAGDNMELEIIDPAEHPELEAEANQTYGITPSPFQISGRYEQSVINSYFDILIRFGDQHVVLSFQDLIEVQSSGGSVDVRLRNLEYDLTSAIKKVVYGFQSVEAVLAALEEPAELTIYMTPETMPEQFSDIPATIEEVAKSIANQSNGRFAYTVVNPDAPGSPVTREQLYEQYEIQPFATSLFSSESYYLHMVLQVGEEEQVIYPSGEMTEADIRSSIENALKRLSPGFLQVVGLWTPSTEPQQNMMGQMQQPISSWQQVRESLAQEYEVRRIDLTNGQVPEEIDVMVLVGPQGMTDKERFAVDQYLMRGGAVIAAAGNYGIQVDPMQGGLGLKPLEGNLRDMLAHYGISVEQSLVMDPQNEPFPVQTTRDVGGTQVREIQAIDYPFFVDIRQDGMASDSPIVSSLPAVTLNWASPVVVDEGKNADREVMELLHSSSESWTRTDTNIQPDFNTYPQLGFTVGSERDQHTLAVSVQGSFESYFKDKPSPFAEGESGEGEATEETATPTPTPPPSSLSTIERSPETSRLVVIGSVEFLDDIVFDLSSSLTQDRYRNSLQFMKNCVAWTTEDLDLLSIRSRGTQTRVLAPLSEREQSFWEGTNYVVALLALVVIGIVWNSRRRNEEPMELLPREVVTASGSSTGSLQV